MIWLLIQKIKKGYYWHSLDLQKNDCYDCIFCKLSTTYCFYFRWLYQTEDTLDGSGHWGLLTSYSGAGYIQDLKNNKTESAAIVDYLFNNLWVTRGTRAVFIDFTVYNANINLFCVIRYVIFTIYKIKKCLISRFFLILIHLVAGWTVTM